MQGGSAKREQEPNRFNGRVFIMIRYIVILLSIILWWWWWWCLVLPKRTG